MWENPPIRQNYFLINSCLKESRKVASHRWYSKFQLLPWLDNMGEASPKLKLHKSSSLTGLDHVQNIIRFVVGIYISRMKIKTPPPNGIILFSPAPPCRTTACLPAWYTRSENSFSCCEPSKLFQSCFRLVSFPSCYDSETKMESNVTRVQAPFSS